MKKEFVTYEQALALKELGFDEKCFNVYDILAYLQDEKQMDNLNLEKISAPIKQQAFDFIESKFGLYYQKADIKVSASEREGYRWRYFIYKIGEDEPIYVDESLLGFLNSEQLQNHCLDEMLKIVKK